MSKYFVPYVNELLFSIRGEKNDKILPAPHSGDVHTV